MKNITESEFEKSINSNTKVIIDFYADWCGPCNVMVPTLVEIEENNEDISIYKVNVEEEHDLTVNFQIRNIPTVLYFENGVMIAKSVGLQTKEKLLANFSK